MVLATSLFGLERRLERSQEIDDLLRSKHEQAMPASEVVALTIAGLNPLIFGLPGGAILPLDQRTAQYPEHIKYYLVKNEAHAPYAAGAYALISGRPAFSLLTSGPGVMQGLVGVYNAMMEFEPMVVVSGNVFSGPLKDPDNRAFQKSNIVQTAQSNTKRAVLAEVPSLLQEILINSYKLSNTHPHGPVLVDIPKNIQLKEARFEYFEPISFEHDAYLDHLDRETLSFVADEIKDARKPFVVLGRGALPARQEAWELIERMGIPFGYTLKGKGILPDDHPQNYGMIGQHGAVATNTAMENSDLVLMIGCNGDDRAFLTREFTRGKTVLINPYQVNANARLKIDFPVSSDSRLSLDFLINLLDGTGQHEKLKSWNAKIREQYKAEPVYNPKRDGFHKHSGISPIEFMVELDSHFNPDVLVLDVGEHQMHGARRLNLNLGRYNDDLYGQTPLEQRASFKKRVITSGTAGTMATSIPYTAGIKIADPSLDVLTLIGDGGFEMQPSSLWLLSANNLDAHIVVMNNGVYGQVFEWMRAYHEKRVEHTPTTAIVNTAVGNLTVPVLEGFSKTYGLPHNRVFDSNTLIRRLQNYKTEVGPRVLEAFVSPMGSYPMIPNGKTSSDAIIPTYGINLKPIE